MQLPAAVESWLARWWASLRRDHSILGIVSAGKEEEEGKVLNFTVAERVACLGMTTACTWISVYMQHWVRKERRDLLAVPKGLENLADSGACALASGLLNLMIGKSLVKLVLQKDWDKQEGARGTVSTVANSWAVMFSFGALAHAANVILRRPWEVARPLLSKWADSAAMTLALVEPIQLGAMSALGF
mmetsp:Transcript_73812/g.227994  ORF Transcript_73812/g.227994 Transcript_73812/m.227994 type:complete len:188 (-) Transcript_73812:107-670(-)|eukprot:CAMPEP_0204604326 /NCGR_PEP_ID=MMETSP0661-20131031/57790_1 /ASSEMBLY_ACC=CAM_ASM_000606 /TAXON_ID=109239 /ORGANISM="Alexandrium margalefi, Strain AMGDE01CS-322" /LENGTH=187 /DNA_ID=CAMNT_0051615469 /DNA_START=37 /DNA_END=600 /DNA_ORIENTATION=+